MADRPFLLNTVEEAFGITGRGIVVVHAFPKGGCQFRIWNGDVIELRRSDGSCTKTHIRCIEHLKSIKGGSSWGLLLPPEIVIADVLVGTEIWWMAPAPKRAE